MLAGCQPDADPAPATAGSSTSSSRQAEERPDDGVLLETPAPIPETDIRFARLGLPAGESVRYRTGEEAGHLAILESLGGGVAFIDFDADGAWDLVFPGGGAFRGEEISGLPTALLWNRGSGVFSNIAEAAGVAPSAHYSHGAAACDYDNDGFADLLITGYGGLQLFHNLGDGTFETVDDPQMGLDTAWSSSAAWGDFNRDGVPDLFVAHYVDWSFANHPACRNPAGDKADICPPRSFAPLPDRMYLGNGDGTFRDASAEFGLREDGKGLGVLAADVDLDGDIDVYVTNDTTENFLYLNDEGRTFIEQGKLSGVALNDIGHPDGSMGIDLGDLDGDGLPDLCVANYERETTAIYRNQGRANFLHVSQAFGVAAVGSRYVGWGTVAADFDLDGDDDLLIANGHVIRFPLESTVAQTPLLFENGGETGRRLTNVSAGVGGYFREAHHGRGAARGDLDRDGRIDVAISNAEQPIAILKNQSQGRHHFLTLQLVGTTANRPALGSVVTLRRGEKTQIGQLQGGGSYASTHAAEVTFGLGTDTETGEVTIRWPSGVEQSFRDLKSDRRYRLIEGDARDFELPAE